jgi:hypothetical protein
MLEEMARRSTRCDPLIAGSGAAQCVRPNSIYVNVYTTSVDFGGWGHPSFTPSQPLAPCLSGGVGSILRITIGSESDLSRSTETLSEILAETSEDQRDLSTSKLMSALVTVSTTTRNLEDGPPSPPFINLLRLENGAPQKRQFLVAKR